MSDRAIDPRPGLSSFRRFTWWTLAGTTVFFLVEVVGEWVADPDPPPGARAVGGVALAVVVVAAAVLLARRLAVPAAATARAGARTPAAPTARAGARTPGGVARGVARGGVAAVPLPAVWLGAGGAAAAVLGGLLLADRSYGAWSYAPATIAAIAATFLPARPRWTLVAATGAGAAMLGGTVAWASGDGVIEAVAYPAGLTALVAWITLGMLWSWDVADRLDEARSLAGELAVKDERLRFAADLHDIQGHHLQVIALKSELAARLAERDPARAAAEMEEVRRLATDAIRDTRAVVQGYRRTTLDEEIANATRVLGAAGIDARMTVDPTGPAPADPHLLGLVMREATTNVLRHSRARRAEVDYRVVDGRAELRIGNDGAAGPASGGGPGPTDRPGPADAGAPEPTGTRTGTGTGLRSLAERLAAVGGALTWTRDGDRFEVAASLPIRAGTAPEVPAR